MDKRQIEREERLQMRLRGAGKHNVERRANRAIDFSYFDSLALPIASPVPPAVETAPTVKPKSPAVSPHPPPPSSPPPISAVIIQSPQVPPLEPSPNQTPERSLKLSPEQAPAHTPERKGKRRRQPSPDKFLDTPDLKEIEKSRILNGRKRRSVEGDGSDGDVKKRRVQENEKGIPDFCVEDVRKYVPAVATVEKDSEQNSLRGRIKKPTVLPSVQIANGTQEPQDRAKPSILLKSMRSPPQKTGDGKITAEIGVGRAVAREDTEKVEKGLKKPNLTPDPVLSSPKEVSGKMDVEAIISKPPAKPRRGGMKQLPPPQITEEEEKEAEEAERSALVQAQTEEEERQERQKAVEAKARAILKAKRKGKAKAPSKPEPEPEPETEEEEEEGQEEGYHPKKSRRPSIGPIKSGARNRKQAGDILLDRRQRMGIPIYVYRFDNKASASRSAPSQRRSVNPADVLRTLLDQAIDKEFKKLKAPLERKATENFKEEIDALLLKRSDKIENFLSLHSSTRKAEKKKLEMQQQLLELRAERRNLAAQKDSVRYGHEIATREHEKLVENASAFEAIASVVDRGKARQHQTENSVEEDNNDGDEIGGLTALVFEVKQAVAGGRDAGNLGKVKEFNKFLHRSIDLLRGTKF